MELKFIIKISNNMAKIKLALLTNTLSYTHTVNLYKAP